MILRRDSWTHDEDVLIIETLTDFGRRGMQQREAFRAVCQQLPHRSYAAVSARWFATLKPKLPAVYKEIPQEEEKIHMEVMQLYDIRLKEWPDIEIRVRAKNEQDAKIKAMKFILGVGK